MSIKTVVIPAAGLGTRGLPFTKEVPKELIPIVDTPALQLVVEECLEAGVEQVVLVTSEGKGALERYFAPSPQLETWLRAKGKKELADKIARIGTMVKVKSVRQDQPLGLGHAVLCAKSIVGDEPFAVCLPDEIFFSRGKRKTRDLAELAKVASKSGGSAVAVLPVPRSETASYGIVDVGDHKPKGDQTPMPVRRTVEKPKPEEAPSELAIIGRYVFQPEIFGILEKVKPGAGGEIQLTDGMDVLAKEGKLQAVVFDEIRYDVGNHLYYVLAQIEEALRRPELASRLKPLLKQRLERT